MYFLFIYLYLSFTPRVCARESTELSCTWRWDLFPISELPDIRNYIIYRVWVSQRTANIKFESFVVDVKYLNCLNLYSCSVVVTLWQSKCNNQILYETLCSFPIYFNLRIFLRDLSYRTYFKFYYLTHVIMLSFFFNFSDPDLFFYIILFKSFLLFCQASRWWGILFDAAL